MTDLLTDVPVRQPESKRRQSFTKGCAIYRQTDPAIHWYVVNQGVVRTCRAQAHGRRQLTGFFFPGDVFGLEAPCYRSTAEAVSREVLVERFSHRNLRDLAETSADPIRRALDSAEHLVGLLGRRNAQERVAAFLLFMNERTGRDEQFCLPMSRSDIADHLGLTVETVSRTFSDFVRRKLIVLAGPTHLQIIDLVRLMDEAGEWDGGGSVSVLNGSAVQETSPAHV